MVKIAAFSNLRSDKDAEDNGKWADIAPGVRFKIRRIRSKPVMDARRKVYGPHERAMNGKDLPDAIEQMCTVRLLSEAVVVDWEGEAMIDADTKEPVPFTKETAAAMFADEETGRDLRALILNFANDSEFFSPEDTKDDLGNSATS